MTQGSNAYGSNRLSDLVLIAGFLTILSYPAFALFETPEALQAQCRVEKRTPSRRPTLWELAATPSRFATDFKSFFDDQFAGRGRLVTLNSAIRYHAFNVAASARVLIGRHGALFYAGEPLVPRHDFGHEAAKFRRVLHVTQRRLDRLRDLLVSRRDWAHEMGAEFFFVIAPDKSTIYPELMPEWMNQLDEPSFTDCFVAHMRATSDVEIIDLRPALERAKASGKPLYYLRDTHWNYDGALAGSREITRRLQEFSPAIKTLGADDVYRSPASKPYHGDLSGMLHLESRLAERSTPIFLKAPRARPITFPCDATPVKSWTAPPQAFRVADARLPKALVYHDSFMELMVRYLAESFDTSIFIYDQRVVAGTVKGYKPDVVILECVERNLYYLAYQTDDLLPTIEPALLAEAVVDRPTRTKR